MHLCKINASYAPDKCLPFGEWFLSFLNFISKHNLKCHPFHSNGQSIYLGDTSNVFSKYYSWSQNHFCFETICLQDIRAICNCTSHCSEHLAHSHSFEFCFSHSLQLHKIPREKENKCSSKA